MQTIALLDQNTIDQIAAGEVVERPASVVKELMENAIDARASAVTVEIRDGGTSLIRITDNGEGIPADQVRMAFLRHATSKLRKVEELTGITSLGFRGEALSSISAVARVELITKTQDSLCGTRYCIEGGVEKCMEEIGAPGGTTFLVRNLFFNTPARAKFLKSATAEGNQVTSVVEQLALSHPEISFKYISNGQNKLYTSGNGNRKEVVYQIYGREMTRELLSLEAEMPGMKLYGFIGKPTIARGNRNYENYYVNGRYVKNAVISKAIEDGYHGFMMQHRYPFTLLYLEIDGSKVDVNVHPAKREVRFSSREELYHRICLAIQNTLMGGSTVPKAYPGSEAERKRETREERKREEVKAQVRRPEPFEQKRRSLESPSVKTDSVGPASDRAFTYQRPVFPKESVLAEERAAYRTDTGKSRSEAGLTDGGGTAAAERSFIVQGPASEQASAAQRPVGDFTGNVSASAGAGADPAEKAHMQAAAETGSAEKAHIQAATETGSADKAHMQAATETGSADETGHAEKHDMASAATATENKIAGKQTEEGKMPVRSADRQETAAEKSYEQISLFSEDLLKEQGKQQIRMIGQVFNTYWLAERDGELLLIDQHAAHEKVMYEQMLAEYRTKTIDRQMLMPPVIVSLSLNEADLMQENLAVFQRCGYEIEAFGGREYKICSVPANLGRTDTRQLFRELLDGLTSVRRHQTPEAMLEKLATAACKAAVKGNQQLSLQEAQALIEQMMTLENPYHCPHGRPTVIRMSRYDLDKKFKRIL